MGSSAGVESGFPRTGTPQGVPRGIYTLRKLNDWRNSTKRKVSVPLFYLQDDARDVCPDTRCTAGNRGLVVALDLQLASAR